MQNNLRLTSNLLYRLKREFGREVIFYSPTQNDYNIETGQVTRNYQQYPIKRVIIMPTRNMEFFTYTLAYIVANKNFTYGANYDRIRRNMIVDARDISVPIQTTWRCSYDGVFYEIEELRESEDFRGYIVQCLRTGADEQKDIRATDDNIFVNGNALHSTDVHYDHFRCTLPAGAQTVDIPTSWGLATSISQLGDGWEIVPLIDFTITDIVIDTVDYKRYSATDVARTLKFFL